jgi:FKBP12-rapamycin complex-associated protein
VLKIIPAFATVTRNSTARLQEFHLQQMAILVGIIKQHVRNYMPEVFGLVTDLWENVALQLPLVTLVEALGTALDAEFRPFLPTILPPLLKVFDGPQIEKNEKRTQTQMKVFDAFLTFGANIEEYLHLVIPVIVKTYEWPEGATPLRKKAIQTIDGLSRRVNFSDHASRIIHPLVRVLESSNNEVKMAVLDTLCSLVIQLGSDFAIFVPTINKVSARRMWKLAFPDPTTIVLNAQQDPAPKIRESDLQASKRRTPSTGCWYPRVTVSWRTHFGLSERSDCISENNKAPEFSAPAEASKMTVNQQHLKQAWDVSQIATKEDWLDWMHRLAVEFMRESPSHALRACMTLVEVHPPLAKELFNAAFISCWGDLYDQYQVSWSCGVFVHPLSRHLGRSCSLYRIRDHVPNRTSRAYPPAPESRGVHGTRRESASHRKPHSW